MLSCQHRPHPTSPHPRASRPARPPLVSLNACLSESLCCALIQDHCGAVLSPCSEPGIAPTALNAQHPFCSACCVSALLVTHFPGLLSFFFFFFLLSVHYIQALVSKQKRLLFTGCFSMVRMPELPHQQMRCKSTGGCGHVLSIQHDKHFAWREPLWRKQLVLVELNFNQRAAVFMTIYSSYVTLELRPASRRG